MRLALRRSIAKPSRGIIVPKRNFTDTVEPQDDQSIPIRRIPFRRQPPQQRIFSGIQPTGVPHLGNYLGALRQWKDFQDEKVPTTSEPGVGHALFFCIVDLHALTGKQDRDERARLRKESFASLLAIGLDPKYSTMFVQSSVSAHSELMWILSTIASTGYLSRMTQWKSKLNLPETATLSDDETTENLKLGLFSYPVLQAADILLYQPTLVPVGEDQSQHIEFARSMARSFNKYYCGEDQEPLFRVPEVKLSPAKRIMSLRHPEKKMSKSDSDPKSRILITDTDEDIQSKLKIAVTDSIDGISYDPVTRPGISNLIEIMKHVMRSSEDCTTIAKDHETMSKAVFKEQVGREVIKALSGFRDKFNEVMQPDNQLFQEAVDDGHLRANGMATTMMHQIKEIMGLENLRTSRKERKRLSREAARQGRPKELLYL